MEQVRGSLLPSYFLPWPRRKLRQTEIKHLGLPARRHEDVGRLDVSVDDPFSVRRVKRIGNLNSQLEQPLGLERTPTTQLLDDAVVGDGRLLAVAC